MSRKLIFTTDDLDIFNVMYDAVTKHDDSGGVAGLRKITKILSIFDEIGTLNESNDQYLFKSAGDASGNHIIFLEEDQYNYIKSCFDKVKWHPMKAKKLVRAFDFLDNVKESKIEAVKSNAPSGEGTK